MFLNCGQGTTHLKHRFPEPRSISIVLGFLVLRTTNHHEFICKTTTIYYLLFLKALKSSWCDWNFCLRCHKSKLRISLVQVLIEDSGKKSSSKLPSSCWQFRVLVGCQLKVALCFWRPHSFLLGSFHFQTSKVMWGCLMLQSFFFCCLCQRKIRFYRAWWLVQMQPE